MSKVLIFYSKTGAGHFRVAETLAAQIARLGPGFQVVMRDGLETTSVGMRTNPTAVYRMLSTGLLPIYNALYGLTDRRQGIAALRLLVRALWGAGLERIIRAEQPDVIVSTHHFMSPSTIGPVVQRTPFVTVVTDIGEPHRLWFDPRAHTIVVPHQEMVDYARPVLTRWNGHVAQADFACFGFPVDEKFRGLERPPFPTRRLLLMGGGSGAGGMRDQVALLAPSFPDHEIVVVCGWNESLLRSLKALPYGNVRAVGFVDNPQDYMAECDVVITKAGPSTILEAATVGRPLIITDWVGIQERRNVDFVLERRLGVYCPKLSELPEAVRGVYRAYDSFALPTPPDQHDGAAHIAAFVAGLVEPQALGAPRNVLGIH